MSPHLGGGPRESKTLGLSDDLSLCGVGRSNTKEIRAIYFKSRRKGPKSVISNPMDITTFYLQFSAYKTGLRIYILGISFIILLSAFYKIFFSFCYCCLRQPLLFLSLKWKTMNTCQKYQVNAQASSALCSDLSSVLTPSNRAIH